MLENKEAKGQRQKKCRVNPQLELKSQAAKKIGLRAMQGLKDEQLLVWVLSMVMAKELSLEEMVIKFNK